MIRMIYRIMEIVAAECNGAVKKPTMEQPEPQPEPPPPLLTSRYDAKAAQRMEMAHAGRWRTAIPNTACKCEPQTRLASPGASCYGVGTARSILLSRLNARSVPVPRGRRGVTRDRPRGSPAKAP